MLLTSEYDRVSPYIDAMHIVLESDTDINMQNAGFKKDEVLRLLTEETSPVNIKMQEKLYQAVLDKAHIDFDTIPKSEGNIRNYTGYVPMTNTLSTIRDLAEKEKRKDVLVYVTIVETAIKNIENLSATYNRGFVMKKPYVALEYNIYVYTCVQATSALIYSFIEYVKDPASTSFTVKITNSKLRADKFYFEQLDKFNKFLDKHPENYRKMLENIIEGDKKGFMGADMAVGIAAVSLAAFAIVPITRALVYQIYRLRTGISDLLAQQAKFLEMNEECVKYNTEIDKNKKKTIIEKQKKLAGTLNNLSDKIRVKSAKSINDSERELKKDNSDFSVDNLRNDVSNSSFELI